MPFQVGNPGGPGRPKGTGLWKPFREEAGRERMLELMEKALSMAAAGDPMTLKMCLDRGWPVPTEATKLLEQEVEELKAELAELRAKPRLVA